MRNGKEVYIVGGGPSLKGFDFACLADKDTIAVNVSVFDVPNPNYFITVDYSFLIKMKGMRETFLTKTCPKFFVADLSHPYLIEHRVKCCIMDMRLQLRYDLSLFDVIIKAKRKDGIGFDFADFRTGTNSGYCALQLAIILGYTKIHLLGIDLQTKKKTHYHDMYGYYPAFGKRLLTYFQYFTEALRQIEDTKIEVISHSKISLLNQIIEYQSLDSIGKG